MSAAIITGPLLLSKENVLRVFDEANTRYPAEACGVFTKVPDGTLNVVPITNIHSDPLNQFLMDPYGLLDLCLDGRLEGVVGLFHSHCRKLPHPSSSDLALIELTTMPHLIVAVDELRASRFLWASWVHAPLAYGSMETFNFYG